MGLEMLAAMGNKEILVQGDLELPARQLNGRYRVGGAKPLPFFERGCVLLRPFDGCTILHVRRDANKLADQLANLGIDAALKRITRAKVD